MIDTKLSDLLELQLLDSEIDRLLERRQSLPELADYKSVHEQEAARGRKHPHWKAM